MTNDEYIIELDEYVDLSYFNLCVEEFKNSFHLIPNESKQTGYFSLDNINPEDSQTINLRILKDTKYVYDFASIDKHDRWKDGPLYDLFPTLKKFISTLPLKNIGRIFISFTENGTDIIPHPDFMDNQKTWRPEFFWFSLVGNKRMWVTDYDSTLEFYKNGNVVEDRFKKVYSKGVACRFNPVLLHGTECGDDFSASIRIDGEYTKEFRKKIFGDTKWNTEFEFVDDSDCDPRKDMYDQ
jgi:hypothetical protein|tara:strand:+ start:78 stop:794 length:717 start_codon:yes stop_codon:yes gene_type:complete